MPPAPLGVLRGVRRIFVRNPDGRISRPERVVRLGDTIVVNAAAWRVVRPNRTGTQRPAADIANLFVESTPNSLSLVWQQARIAFRLIEPVGTVLVDADLANLWPFGK